MQIINKESTAEQSGERSQCKSILVVEDDTAIRETLKFALEMSHYSVFTAANGQEALDVLSTIPKPCLILLDLMMPVMNGWEFSKALDENMMLAPIPVVVVTAFLDKAKTIRSKGVLKKPVDLEMLLKIVSQWCGIPAKK
jgi:CheY-like chemotaxis protein